MYLRTAVNGGRRKSAAIESFSRYPWLYIQLFNYMTSADKKTGIKLFNNYNVGQFVVVLFPLKKDDLYAAWSSIDKYVHTNY